MMALACAIFNGLKLTTGRKLEKETLGEEFVLGLEKGHRNTKVAPTFGKETGREIEITKGVLRQGPPPSPLPFPTMAGGFGNKVVEEAKEQGARPTTLTLLRKKLDKWEGELTADKPTEAGKRTMEKDNGKATGESKHEHDKIRRRHNANNKNSRPAENADGRLQGGHRKVRSENERKKTQMAKKKKGQQKEAAEETEAFPKKTRNPKR